MTCSKSGTRRALKQGLKSVQSQQLKHQNDADIVVLVSLLLTLKIIYTLFQSFYFNSKQVNAGKHMPYSLSYIQKQSTRCDFQKSCSRNIQTVYRITSIQKCDFSFLENTLRHGYSSVNMPHICNRTPFSENSYEELHLYIVLNTEVINEVLSKQVKNCLKYISILITTFSNFIRLPLGGLILFFSGRRGC